MSKTSKQIGWHGTELDAILDRNTTTRRNGKPVPVGYDPAAIAKLLG